MTIQSPTRRLRLFMLSFSLFACGVTAAQTTSPPVGPPGISMVETKLEKAQFFTRGVPTIADPVVDEKTGRLKPPNDNSDLRRMGSGEVPGDVRVKAGNDQAAQLYFYYVFIKVKNTGPYDFVFSDAGTREELKRTRFDL